MSRSLLTAAAAVLSAVAVLSLSACGGRGGPSAMLLPHIVANTFDRPRTIGPSQAYALSPFMADTSVGIHALQVFDEAHGYTISAAEGAADGQRYASVWGVRSPHMASAWHTQNAGLNALIYTPYDTDATGSGLSKSKGWWIANHPDWILYECDQTTIAYVSGLPGIPLDIADPAVRDYQVGLLGSYAEENGYDGVAADIVSLNNNTGHADSGHGGCGVWTNNHTTWVAKFSGTSIDPRWATATEIWVAAMHAALRDQAVFPRPLGLAVNTNVDAYQAPVGGRGGDSGERAIVANADVIMNEAGFAMWGSYVGDRAFNNAVGWMEFAQSLGEATLTTDDWNHQTQAPSTAELDYSIATYLMGKEQAAALYVGQNQIYGKENYYAEYAASIGRPCAAMYGGPDDPHYRGENVYLRRYSGGIAVVNVNGTTPYTVDLPKTSYRDIEGGHVTSPLTIQPDSGVVLLTAHGCT